MPTINIDGIELYYQVQGTGLPIVFIHPPMLTSKNFTYQQEELSKQFQTIVFDIRGHGNSSFSKDPLTFPMISNDIKQILDHLRINQAFLCGYSTGGSIVLDFLLKFPERALGGILIGALSEVNDLAVKSSISLAKLFSTKNLLTTLALSICFGNSSKVQTFKNLYRDARKGNPENIKQYFNESLKYNCTSQLDKILHPILLVYGEKDQTFNHYAHLINQKLVSSELVFIKKAQHQLPTKNSQELNKLITDFINNQENLTSSFYGNISL